MKLIYSETQIDSSTLDGNVEFVHSQNSSILHPTKLLTIVNIKCLFYSEINAILFSLFSVFTLSYLILGN